MAQAGIHGIVGVAVRKWAPAREWFVLGIVLGSILPDVDNFAVAAATVMGKSTEGLHRTFSHSLFIIAAIILVSQLIAALIKRPRWGNLGLGLGIGILMHVLLDLIIWFNGVHLLWPLTTWVNLWEGVTVPEWFSQLMMPAEMLCFALYFVMLAGLARKQGINLDRLKSLRMFTAVQAIIFLIFLVLVYTMKNGFLTIYGAFYLLSLGLTITLTIQMRQTIEAAV
ncbi:MAG: metal-dependent hydrolase [Chloroflexi bacterium]|nr:metal-dependent hydrolase [Chloroflexota bacterium]